MFQTLKVYLNKNLPHFLEPFSGSWMLIVDISMFCELCLKLAKPHVSFRLNCRNADILQNINLPSIHHTARYVSEISATNFIHSFTHTLYNIFIFKLKVKLHLEVRTHGWGGPSLKRKPVFNDLDQVTKIKFNSDIEAVWNKKVYFVFKS